MSRRYARSLATYRTNENAQTDGYEQINFRISPLKSNFSAQKESEVEKKYRTGFDRSSDTEQVSNSRKSLHVGCLWRI